MRHNFLMHRKPEWRRGNGHQARGGGSHVAASGLLLSACGWGDFGNNKFNDEETLGQTITEVRFANDSGDVKITVGDTVEVRRDVKYDDRSRARPTGSTATR